MSTTLLLDVVAWDLCLSASGDIALASEPYAVAQDVASAQRTFQSEVWYDTTQGIPYLQDILGRPAGPQLLKVALVDAAVTVPDVVSAVCYLTLDAGTRQVMGQTQVTLADGSVVVTTSGSGAPFIALTTAEGAYLTGNMRDLAL